MKNNTNAIIVGNISHQNSSLVLSFIETFVITLGFFNHNSLSESFFGNTTISLFIFSTQFLFIVSHDRVAIALFQSIIISVYSHLL